MGRSSDDDRWVSLQGPKRWLPPVLVNPLILVIFVIDGLILSFLFLRDLPLVGSIAILIGVAAAIFALMIAIVRLAYPDAYLNPAISTIRARGRRAHYSDITAAQLLVSASKTRRALNLLLHSDEGLRAVVLVRDARGRTLDHDVAALVRDMIRRSNIAMPPSEYDPAGKFARYNFPGHVTLEAASALIERPPEFGDALPIPPRI